MHWNFGKFLSDLFLFTELLIYFKAASFSTIQLKFFFFKSSICWWKNFSFFPTGFLRKVYGILTAQLMLTIFVAGVFMYTESIKTFVQGRYCVENL